MRDPQSETLFAEESKTRISAGVTNFAVCRLLCRCGFAKDNPAYGLRIYSNTGKPYFKVFWNTDLASVNLIPFKTLWAQLTGNNSYVDQSKVNAVSTLNLLSNVFLFCPLGVFLPLLWSKFRGTPAMISTAIAVSARVEIIQLFIGRTSDIDEVILNSLGILIGFGVYKFIHSIRKKPVRNT